MTLLGHSIGAHIILELMQDKEIEPYIHKVILLYPCIERMA